MKVKTLAEHLAPGEPKKILSLDGGGIRGALTLGYLKKIETILKAKSDKPDEFRLCHYFDLIGGTSTGAIIATCLAIGMSVDEIKEKYMALGRKIFRFKWLHINTIFARYSNRKLTAELKSVFKEYKLGGPELKTGLCVVAKRIDTNSTWFFLNNPRGKYYNDNKDINLWEIVKASASAPSYFLPTIIDVGNGEKGAFVDGGVSLSNNPSLGLLMVSQLKGFKYDWGLGEENICLYSLGTGYGITTGKYSSYRWKNHFYWARSISDFYMEDANWHNQAILQWLSKSETAKRIDTEVDYLHDDYLTNPPALKYYRYNFEITLDNLKKLFPEHKYFEKSDVKSLLKMDKAANRDFLYQIGEREAENDIKESHFY